MSYRFAPSPTGALHFGNARIAVFNALAAAAAEKPLILRIDDTEDAPGRGVAALIAAIVADLKWLGLEFSQQVRQSERVAVAMGLFAELKAKERVYECFESEEELAALRKAAASAGRPPIYPRRALTLSQAQKDRLRKQNLGYWRFKLSDKRLKWQDRVYGEITTDLTSLSDPVVVNKLGKPLFLLAGIADDLEMGISNIIRGADHLNGSAIQLDICAAVSKTPPQMAHLPLVSGGDKRPLSKRQGEEMSVGNLRRLGFEPLALANFMLFWGSNYKNSKPAYRFDELVNRFHLAKTGKASLSADMQLLTAYNRNFIRKMPFALAKQRVKNLDEALWRAAAGNIDDFGQLKQWQEIMRPGWQPPQASLSAKPILREALNLLEDAEDFQHWSKSLKERLGPGNSLRPIRLALTGLERGASIEEIYRILGKREMANRLDSSLR